MSTHIVVIDRDPLTLGEAATSADVDRFAGNLAAHLAEQFPGETFTVRQEVGARGGCASHGEANEAIRELFTGDGWTRLLGDAAWASDSLSIDNGNTYTTVADLSDAGVASALDSPLLDNEICEELHNGRACAHLSSDETPAARRAWLAAYCAAHIAKFGEPLVFG